MATKIVLKNGSGAPLASDLVQGEVGLDLTNKRIYSENSSGTVIEMGTSPSTIDINAGTVDGISSLSTANGTDVSFAGVSATKFFWDASAERIGLGTTTPATDLHIVNSGAAQFLLQAGASDTCYFLMGDAADTNIGWIAYDNSNDSMNFRTNNTERMRIDSSGNVGIGTSSPASALDVSGDTRSDRFLAASSLSAATPDYSFKNDGSLGMFRLPNVLGFSVSGTERMRIDSSGNLLVGTTDSTVFSNSGAANSGAVIDATGRIDTARAGTCAIFNRLDSDGAIAEFRKDGTTVGSIGAQSGRLFVGSASAAGVRFDTTQVVPMSSGAIADNTVTLGDSGYRFKDLYLSGGVYVGGTTSANYLDDYEEGTFTPTLIAITTSPSVTYTKQEGTYTKVGNLVYVTVDVRWSAQSGGAGTMQIGGLPFSITTGYSGGVIFERSSSISYSASYDTFGYEGSGGPKVTMVVSGSGASTAGYNITSMGTGAGYVIFSFAYRV